MHSSGCIGLRLYLPEHWAADSERRKAVGVPTEVTFRRKWEIGLDLLDTALGWGLPRYPVIADAGYGDSAKFQR